jgi:(E)-4-hydroxy-3-methylbut-2-enyl-diphosphate synthase
MSYNIDNKISRKKTKQIMVGDVKVGGDALISVQSMTNTITEDVEATVNQIKSLENEGADIVRVSCPNTDATKALKEIVNNADIPIVADIHFHYKRALEAADSGAACLRVNPGNIGPEKIKEVIAAAKANKISMRIGVNAGSLDKKILDKYKEPGADALVDSALENIKLLESNNFDNFKISVKASNVHTMVAAYEKLSLLTNYPLHLGLTEAGTYVSGSIKSSMSIGKLLSQGIGDTIRVSLTADPVEEIKIGYEILKSLDLRSRGVKIISCPSCARQAFPVIETVKVLEEKLSHIKQSITVSIIGCIVNGPGEALNSDIGITGGGKGSNMLYLSGVTDQKISNDDIVNKVVKLVEERVAETNA